MSEPASLTDLASRQRVIVCVGGGGVGKTTIAAAIAMKAAQMGRTACVLTIDPARRLANALGMPELGNSPVEVDPARFDAAGLPRPRGRMFAMMLDTKRTWDDLVLRFAPTPAQAQHILANRYYQNISGAIAGSQEFMAMEKLHELSQSGAYDLLVLDTPPTRHALDFLDAPKKMMEFMDDRMLSFLTLPGQVGRFGLGMLTSSTGMMFAVLQRITGFNVLKDISDYVQNFTGMHAGFRDRAFAVQQQLRSDGSTFVLVAAPNAETVEEAAFFFRKLRAGSMPFGGFIVNRVQPSALSTPEEAQQWRALRDDPSLLQTDQDLASRLIENFAAQEATAATHAGHVQRLREQCPGPHFHHVVPAFEHDVQDLPALAMVSDRL